jgi:hypothetical protein
MFNQRLWESCTEETVGKMRKCMCDDYPWIKAFCFLVKISMDLKQGHESDTFKNQCVKKQRMMKKTS